MVDTQERVMETRTTTTTTVNFSFTRIKEAPFSNKEPKIFPWEGLKEVHPLIRNMLSSVFRSPGWEKNPPVAGRLAFFQKAPIPEIPFGPGRFPLQDRSEGRILCNSSQKKTSRKYIRFLWERDLYEFTCLCFGLACAPRIFTKLLKVPIALLRRLNMRIVIYLDDILIFGRSIKQAMQARDTLIFLFQKLGFVLNLEKSQFQPVKTLKFLGLNIDTQTRREESNKSKRAK